MEDSYARLLLRPEDESGAQEQFVGFQWQGPPIQGNQVGEEDMTTEGGYTLTELGDQSDQEMILSEDQPDLLTVKREVHENIYLGNEKHTAQSPQVHIKQEERDKRKRTKTGLIYECTECNKKFQYLASLQIHRRFHSGQKLTQCDECGKRFATQYALKRHVRTHEKPETSVCTSCGAAFADKRDFERHVRYHVTGEPAYSCKECDDTFDTYGAIKAHRSKKHRKHWFCRHCYAKFPTEKLYQEHRAVHGTYNCPQCHMKFITQEMLDMHVEEAGEHRPPPNSLPPPIRISKDTSVFECDNCGKRFMRRDSLIEHYRMHTGVGLVACDQCPMKFTTYARLRKHMTRHATKKSYPCPHCEKVFGTERYLHIHVMKHTGDQLPYPCQLCSKQFLRSNSLRNHMFSHLKRFPCSRCPAIFTSDRQLKKHRRSHKNICSICSMTFETFELLHMHFMEYHPDGTPPEPPAENPNGIPIVEGCDVDALAEGAAIDAATKAALLRLQMQYSCEVCDKKFSRATDLRIHMCTHARNFPCSRCFQTFTSERKLKKHRKIHHKNVCNYCGIKFEMPHFLENHYKHQHPDTREARGEPSLEEEEPVVEETPKKKPPEKPPPEPRIYPCHICSKEFIRGPDLRIHLCTHMKNFKCSQCSRAFSSQRKLKRHRKLHKNICPLCETKFDTQESIKQHFDEVHPDDKEVYWDDPSEGGEEVTPEAQREQSVSCLLCGDVFSRNSDLRSHMKTHEKTFACRQCNLVLPSSELLKEHRKIHRIICRICKENLDSIALAQLHYLEDHPDAEMPQFVVPTGDDLPGVPDEEELEEKEASMDEVSNVDEATFEAASVKQEPIDEQPPNEDVKLKVLLPFCCEICGKRFARKVAHKNHMYSHAKSFPCTRCTETFPSERQLKKHRKTHKTTCKYCDAVCESKDALQVHYLAQHPNSKQGRVKVPFEEVFIETDPLVENATDPIEEVFTIGVPSMNEFLGREILGDE